MNEIVPGSGDVTASGGEQRRPEAEIVAEGEAAAAVLHDIEASHAAVEDPERRCADIKIWVEAECDYFGIEPKNDPVADQITQILFQHETTQFDRGRTDYNVTEDQRRRLDRVIERGMTAASETAETAAMLSKAEAEDAETQSAAVATEDAEASAEGYREAVAELSGLSNADKIQTLLTGTNTDGVPYRDLVPASEIARLQSFSQILTIADRVPTDAPLVRQRINQLDISQGVPDPVSFARSFLFDGPESHLKSGVSDATQDAIAAELGIVRNEFSAKTGGDINDIYKNGVGTKLVRDPETGELREEPVYLEPGQDVEIREGQYIGLSGTNEPVMKIVGEHTYTSDLPENPTDHDMTMYGMTTQWIAKLNDVNMAEMFFPHSVMERGGGHIKLNMPDDFNRAQRLSQAFFGAMSGYNGELLDQADLDRIPYLMQFQNKKGDAVIGDVNPDQMRADYQRQGIIGKDGHLDWDRFAAMVEANRSNLYTEANFATQARQAA